MQEQLVIVNLIDFSPEYHQEFLNNSFRDKLQQVQQSIKNYRKNRQHYFGYIPVEYYNCLEFALMAIECDHQIANGFSDEIWANRKFQIALLRKDPTQLLGKLNSLVNDREMVRVAISQPGFGYILKSTNYKMESDVELQKIAEMNGLIRDDYMLLCENWKALDIHHPEERKIVKKNLERNGDEFERLTHMHGDRELALTAIKDDPSAIYFVSEELKRDREFILEAIQSRSGKGLKKLDKLPDYWKGDRQVVLEIAKQKITLLKFSEYDWRSDDEFVIELLRCKSITLNLIPQRFKTERDLVLALVKYCGIALQLLEFGMRDDREIVLESVKDIPSAYQFASDRLKHDREIIEIAVQGSSNIFHIIPSDLKNEETIILKALKSGLDYKHVPNQLKSDRNFVLQVCQIGKIPYSSIPLEFISQFEIIAEFMKNMNRIAFKYGDLPEYIQKDKNQLLKLIEFISPKLVILLPNELVEDTEFLLEYVKFNGDIIFYLDRNTLSYGFIERAATVNRHGVGKHFNILLKAPALTYQFHMLMAEKYGIYSYSDIYGSALSKEMCYKLRMKYEYPHLVNLDPSLL